MAISNGQQVIRTAQGYLGAREGAPNKSGAPIVDECQALYGLSGVPWCACFVGYVSANSGADAKYKASAKAIISPSTQSLYDAARAKGWVHPGNGQAIPGDLFIIPGVHVGIITGNRDPKTFTTVEGNSSDSVTSNIRAWSDGWQRISLPGVGTAGPAATVDGFGFDDTRVKLYGGWTSPEARDGQMRAFAAANPTQWTQAVKVAKDSPYAFRAGPTGTYNHWTFGPWLYETGKATRDAEQGKYEKANKTTARPWKKTYKGA